eukprot:g24483.t1
MLIGVERVVCREFLSSLCTSRNQSSEEGPGRCFWKRHDDEEEISWMKEIMFTGEITRIHRDGQYGEGNLPGYPGHETCLMIYGYSPQQSSDSRGTGNPFPSGYLPWCESTYRRRKKAWSGEVIDNVPEVQQALSVPHQTEQNFSKLRKITVKKLKEFCAHHGLAQNGLRPALVARVWQYWTTERQQELLKQVRLRKIRV